MALVKGTNCGFVLTAPTTDPTGVDFIVDKRALAGKFQSPANAVHISEIGWYCDNITEASNFEVGLYNHNVVDDEAEDRLYVSNTNAKGTIAGWKSVAVNWNISPSTWYWLAVQLDDTATATNINYTNTTGEREGYKSNQTTLINPWGTTTAFYVSLPAIYAVYTTGAIQNIAGVVSGQSNVTGSEKTNRKLATTVITASNLTTIIKLTREIVTNVTTTSDVSAITKLNRKIISSFVGQSDVAGSLAITREISSSLTGQVNITGSLSVVAEQLLSGLLSGQSSISGVIKKIVKLYCLADNQSNVSAAIKIIKELQGLIISQSTTSATTKVSKKVIGDISSQTSIVGAIAKEKRLSGFIPSIVTLNGFCKKTAKIGVNISAQSTVIAPLEVFYILGSVVESLSVVTGSLNVTTVAELNIHDIFVDRGDPNNYDFVKEDFTKDDSWHILDLSSIVPVANMVYLHIIMQAVDTPAIIRFRKYGNQNAFAQQNARCLSSSIIYSADVFIPFNNEKVIEYKITNSNWLELSIVVLGWIL